METTPAVALFLTLAVIILAARAAGSLARRLGQSRVLGELIVGIVLGPTLINLLHLRALGIEQAHLDETIHLLAEIGVLLLMFKVGLDVHLTELRKVGRLALFAGVVGAVVPVLLTVPVVLAFNFDLTVALYAGVTLAAMSTSISAQVLLELGHLNTKVGHALLATALVDDVVAILMLSVISVVTATGDNGGGGSIAVVLLRMVAFLGLGGFVALRVLPRLLDRAAERPQVSASFGLPAFALAAAFLFGWAAEALGGVAAITGSFLAGAGISFTSQQVKTTINRAIDPILYALFVPIFFVSVGLQSDLRTLTLDAVPLMLSLLTVAVVSKLIGSMGPALLMGFNRREALQFGVSTISRGEVGLIIMSVALAGGVFTTGDPMFASLFMVVIITTLITPLIMRRLFSDNAEEPEIVEQIKGV